MVGTALLFALTGGREDELRIGELIRHHADSAVVRIVKDSGCEQPLRTAALCAQLAPFAKIGEFAELLFEPLISEENGASKK